MAIKVIEYLIVGEAPNTAVHTFYDPVSANVDTEWTYINANAETTSGDAVQYALRYNDVTELAEVSEGVFVRRASSGDPDDYGSLPNLDPNVLGTALGGTGLATVGTAGQVLSVAANGVDLEYTTNGAGTGTVTSFSAGTTGFSVATATTTPTISGVLNLANGGTGAALVDPNADRLLFWDDSAGAMAFLTPGAGLTITTTTIAASLPSAIFSGSVNNITDVNYACHPNGPNTNGSNTVGAVQVNAVAPFAGTVKNLYIVGATAAGVGGDAFTVYKNGVATALVATIAEAATTGNDTTHSFSVVAGDKLTVVFTTNSASGNDFCWGFELEGN